MGQGWTELWQDISFRRTNYSASDKRPPEQNFLLTTTAFRAGCRHYLTRRYDTRKVQVAWDGYGRIENVFDLSKNRMRHRNLYNNNFRGGLGAKLRLQREDTLAHWLRYLQADLIVEHIWMNPLVRADGGGSHRFEANNWRMGVNAWSNSGGDIGPGYELFLDMSYHSSNFAGIGEKNYLIAICAPKLYYRLTASNLDIYAGGEWVNDFQGNNSWNQNPYSNNLKGNAGIRMQVLQPDHKNLSRKSAPASFLLYTEVAKVHFLQNPNNWQIYEHDWRVGLIVWWPTGEAKYRKAGGQVLPN